MIEFTDEFFLDRRDRDGDEDHVIVVRTRRRGVELEIDALDFLLALTGRAGMKCKVRVRLDRLPE